MKILLPIQNLFEVDGEISMVKNAVNNVIWPIQSISVCMNIFEMMIK